MNTRLPSSTRPVAPDQRGPRLELKMQLPTEQAQEFQEWLSAQMEPDPHAPDPLDPVQQVTTLYFDDATRSGYVGRLPDKTPKHRLRRYDANTEWFLEEKLRLGDRVWKRRLPLTEADAQEVVHGTDPLDGPLEWFRSRFRVLNLMPTLLVQYARHAYGGDCGTRVTFDRRIHAARVAPRFLGLTSDQPPILSVEEVVVEVKGPIEGTAFMQEALQWLGETRTTCSKYSRGLEAVGLEPARTSSSP
ncbi:MAG: VTC domain-containing protein [Planctomycetota bacterium]